MDSINGYVLIFLRGIGPAASHGGSFRLGWGVPELMDVTPRSARPRNNFVAQLGDSRLAHGTFGYVGNERGLERNPIQRMNGIQFWIEYLSGGIAHCPPTMNFGLSGDTTEAVDLEKQSFPGIRSRIDTVIATGAGSCLLLAGTNDLRPNAHLSAERTIANLDAVIEAIVAAGMWVFIIAETPRAQLTEVQFEQHLAMRRWILDQAGREHVIVIDVWDALLQSGSDRRIDPRYSPDQLHLNLLGGRLVAEHVWPAIAGLLDERPPTSDRPSLDVGPFTIAWESVPAGCMVEMDDRRETFRVSGTPAGESALLEIAARIDPAPIGVNGKIGGNVRLDVEKALNVPNICASIAVRNEKAGSQRSITGHLRDHLPAWLPEEGFRGPLVVPLMQIAGRAAEAMLLITCQLQAGSPIDLQFRLSGAGAWLGAPRPAAR